MSGSLRIIPALDCELDQAEALARRVDAHPGIYGYKVGFALGLRWGLPHVVERLRRVSKKPIVYDHQKAATDIPDTGVLFARTLAEAGIDEAILFPQAGARTLEAWAKALREARLKVIVGGVMTHPGYLASEGGFLADERVLEIYPTAAKLGVQSFVVPMTRPALVREVLARLGPGPAEGWELYSPGLGAQGGSSQALQGLGRLYAIVGRALLAASDPVAWLDATLAQDSEDA